MIKVINEKGEIRTINAKKRPGVYETEYGNAAVVEDWDDDTAWDIDMGEEIPIEFVTDTWIREA